MILGFGYRARQGKDTVCAAIVEARGVLGVKRYGFADEVKREVNTAFKCCGGPAGFFSLWDSLGGLLVPPRPAWVTPELDPPMDDPLCPYGKYRSLLQWWGTEYRRSQDPDYWVKRLAKTIAGEQPRHAVISDVRFPNEFNWIKSQGGVVVKVVRPAYAIPSTHLSECALDTFKFDYTLVNSDENPDASGKLAGITRVSVRLFDMVTTPHITVPEL